MAYKISAAARQVYAAMDKYINYMRMHVRRPKRVYITKHQHEVICTHLTKVNREQLKTAPAITELKQYEGCEVVIYEGK